MAYYNGFPATYQPMGFQQYQQPLYQPPQPLPGTQMSQANQAQPFSPPTIRAEIVQVDSEAAASAFPVGAGASQMMIAKDESAIYIKSALANGQTALDVYEKRPPAPPAPVFDPSEYVRRDEVETLVAEAMATHASQAATKRSQSKKEDA